MVLQVVAEERNLRETAQKEAEKEQGRVAELKQVRGQKRAGEGLPVAFEVRAARGALCLSVPVICFCGLLR